MKCEHCGKETAGSVNDLGFSLTQPCIDLVMAKVLAPIADARRLHAGALRLDLPTGTLNDTAKPAPVSANEVFAADDGA